LITLVRWFKALTACVQVAPVDFVMSLLLVHTLRDRFSKEDLRSWVKEMRLNVRHKMQTLMWNTATVAPYYDFIQKLNRSDDDSPDYESEDNDMEVDEKPSLAELGKSLLVHDS
jgi:Tfp pilus assembly protein PilP